MATRRRTSNAARVTMDHADMRATVARAPNVLDLHMRVLPRHMQSVSRWLDAGRHMGLCDAESYGVDAERPGRGEYVLVWVRENANPAYMIAPEGMHWTVKDCIRDQMLARVRSFEAALQLIRPVLPPAAEA
jgi:hypothetical protein